MKQFHRLTISLTDKEMQKLEELRGEGFENYSQIFRDALNLYYRLYKAFKIAGYDINKLPEDFERLAYHIYNVEMKQYVILDRELYRVLLKKLQEKYSSEELEKDKEFERAIKGFSNLFYIWHRWTAETKASEKAQEVLKTIEFGGGGEFKKVSDNEFIFRTSPENVVVTKSIIKMLYEALRVNATLSVSGERIFIKLEGS